MAQHTIINIGRQFGSGGKRVADALGETLGITVYDNELIAEAARQSGFDPDLFKKSDEKRRFWSIGNIFGDTGSGGLNDAGIFKVQSEVIRSIAERDDAIFVGRASDYVLRDLECLDVFITAPMEVRKDRVAERLKMSLDEAEALIRKQDKEREAYYNFFTFGNWGVASNYDLCIDSSLLGIKGTAAFITEFGRKAGLISL